MDAPITLAKHVTLQYYPSDIVGILREYIKGHLSDDFNRLRERYPNYDLNARDLTARGWTVEILERAHGYFPVELVSVEYTPELRKVYEAIEAIIAIDRK